MSYTRIEVIVSGAVQSAGPARLESGATIASALRAVGGLAYRPDAVPHGELILRRRPPTSRRIEVRRWQIFDDPADSWQSFPLEHGDVVIFGWTLRDSDLTARLRRRP